MKTALLVLVIVASTCWAEDTTGLTNKVTQTNAGTNSIQFERVYRGTSQVMVTVSRPSTNGEMAVVSRLYYVAGELRMSESDEDGDGFLETMILHAPGSEDIEVFKRQRDGVVKPVSTPVLEFWKKAEASQAATQAQIGRLMRSYIEGKITTKDAIEGTKRIRESGGRSTQELQSLEGKEKR